MASYSSDPLNEEVQREEVLEFQRLLTFRDEGSLSSGDSERMFELLLNLLDDGVIDITYPEEEGLVV